MARLTVEDCLEHVDNRFNLILNASKRARQLAKGATPAVEWDNDKPTVVALREFAEGLTDLADQLEREQELAAQQESIERATQAVDHSVAKPQPGEEI